MWLRLRRVGRRRFVSHVGCLLFRVLVEVRPNCIPTESAAGRAYCHAAGAVSLLSVGNL